jgi:AraC-like DNA-binding protein
LVALVLRPEGEMAELATLRGLRAVRLQAILAGIHAGVSDPEFTLGVLERRLSSRRATSDIAYACGFSDVSYFNRCFRRRFGAPPREFR